MNTVIQKYGPPAMVIGAALYLGWPPAKPMDLGGDLVQAKAVRWKSADLEAPPTQLSLVDPFRAVLVADESETVVEIIPTGPTSSEINDVVALNGLANFGGKVWAIINNKPTLPGDAIVPTDNKIVNDCKLISIHADHVKVQSQDTIAIVRPSKTRKSTKTKPAVTPVVNSQSDLPAVPDVAPPPQI